MTITFSLQPSNATVAHAMMVVHNHYSDLRTARLVAAVQAGQVPSPQA